jgi:hydrophobic/amphiphilic exporter-1 (mainly G- bacteria), HAE1 family
MKILDIPLKRPIAIVIVFSLLSLVGIYEYATMKYELLPPMTLPVVTVVTVYPGASPKEIETQISKKLEDALSGISHIKTFTSQSLESTSILELEFDSDTDIDRTLQDVQRAVNAKTSELPSSVKTPSVDKISIGSAPVIQLAVTANIGKGALYELIKDKVKPNLNRIGGVGQVTMLGGNAREIRVSLSEPKLAQYRVPILLVLQKIGAANLDFPAGNIQANDGEYVVRISGKLKNLDEMRKLVLGTVPDGGNITLGDVAKVEDALADSSSIFRYNGKEAVGLLIVKQEDANAVEVSKRVRAELANMEKEFKADGLGFEIASDSSVFTLGSAHDVVIDIILAIILVGAVMLLFLQDLRNSFNVMMAIPTTLLTTFIFMGVGKFTLNMMSLLSLSMVVGILVDDSIVVIENIHRHRALGASMVEAARIGTREIVFAASSVTLIIITAFLPVSLSGGMIGALLIQFGLTLVVATAVSLGVSFFLTPLLVARLGEAKTVRAGGRMARFGNWFDRAFGKITGLFQLTIDWAFRHKIITIVSAMGLLILSFGFLVTGLVGSEMITEIDRGEFTVGLEMPERTTLEDNDRIARIVEKELRSRSEVDRIYTKVGYDTRNGAMTNKTEIFVSLVPRDKRRATSADVGLAVETAVRRIPGVKVQVVQSGLIDSGASESPVSYIVLGPNYDENLQVANEWAEAMRKVKGTGEVRLSVGNGKPELQVEIDRTKLAGLGLSQDTVGLSLRTALTGDDTLYYSEGGVEYPIKVVLDSFDRTTTEQVGNISFTNDRGRQIKLNEFAAIHQEYGPTTLTRVDRQSIITVSSQAIGRPIGDIDKDVRELAAGISIPAEVEVRASGDLEIQGDVFESFGFALLLSFILIYSTLAILFNSFSYPLSIMFSLPFAMIGGFFALALTGQTLNIFSIMSMILLMGLSSKNAILLVDRALMNHAERGMAYTEAFKEAVGTRIRPIFMTTLTTIFGMLPIALGLGSAGEMKQAMGVVFIGGLTFSLIVTMIIVPVAFLIIDAVKTRLMPTKRISPEEFE